MKEHEHDDSITEAFSDDIIDLIGARADIPGVCAIHQIAVPLVTASVEVLIAAIDCSEQPLHTKRAAFEHNMRILIRGLENSMGHELTDGVFALSESNTEH